MIYLRLFLNFLKIGVCSFGGGYGMIALVRETVVSNGWMTDEAFLDFLAVAESTPGPIAVNMATYIGSVQGGLLGSVLATAGVIIPSLIIILLITILASRFMERAGVKAFLGGVRPCVVGLILGTAITLGLKTMLDISSLGDTPAADWRSFAVLGLVIVCDRVLKHLRKKKTSPILLIVISAGLGIILWGIKL